MESKDYNIHYTVGHIYGSRVSRNGQWLNLQIVSSYDDKPIGITVPIHIGCDRPDKSYVVIDGDKAVIENVRVYPTDQPKKEEPKAFDGDLPF